jgi:hypothetical protein
MGDWRQRIPFSLVKGNFYAGTIGMDAQLQWPNSGGKPGRRTVSPSQLTLELLPAAADGLKRMGVNEDEAKYLLSIVRNRAVRGVNGAVWQRQAFAINLRCTKDPQAAAKQTMQQYRERAKNGRGAAVHTWTLPA